MNEYRKRILQARNDFIKLNFEQEKELFKIYNDAGDRLVGKILNMTDSRTKIHNIETYKIINEYRTELFHNLNKTIENNIYKSSDIQKGVQLSFVDVIAPNVKINEALKRTVTKISSDSVKQLIAGEYYKDGKTLSKRLWNITGNNGNKIDAIIKENIAKGANAKELAKELNKYVNPKNRITPKTFQDGLGGDNISYQARRLARTSITHAQTEVMIQNAKKNPFCKGLKWNLSASHFSRMHGKRDECDDYNGKTYKPEEVPLQHPNCLCYFTEVLEEFDKCIESMKDWSNGKKNPDIDEWIKAGDDKTSIKISTPSNVQTKMDINKTDNVKTIPKTYSEKINNIKARIENNDGNIQEKDLKEAGGILYNEIKSNKDILKSKMDIAKDEWEKSDLRKYSDLKQQLVKDMTQTRFERKMSKDEFKTKWGVDVSEWGDLNNKILKKLDTAGEKEVNLEESYINAKKAYEGDHVSNAKDLATILSKVRRIGIDNINIDEVVSGAHTKKHIADALKYYPTDWVESSISKSVIRTKIADRGSYTGVFNTIALPDDENSFSIAIHELGHRFEDVNKGILQAEKKFYNRRTKGEELQWLGGAYDKSELSRFDNFIDKYMGKDYEGKAYELVSMGFQYAYTEPNKLLEDKDMAEWILGILALK